MDIKKANVKLLLGKIRIFLDAQPAAAKKGKKFIEAEKALTRLEQLFPGKKGELRLLGCSEKKRVIDPDERKLLGCSEKKRVIDPGELKLMGCSEKKRVIDPGELKLLGCSEKKRVIDS
jgi:hypothetical protein